MQNTQTVDTDFDIIDPIDKIVRDSKNNKTIFLVENGFNTCYISALLMGLFYKPSQLDSMLHTDPKEIEMIYLQEIIKTKFVDRARSGTSILMENMNEIRTYANICGWLTNSLDELLEQQDVNEFFIFLAECTKLPSIELQRITLTEGMNTESDFGEIESIPFINLSAPGDVDEINIKTLLDSWMNVNTVDVKRSVITQHGEKKEETVKGLNMYKIMNIPYAIAISLNRFNNEYNKRIVTKIDIQKKIKLHNIHDEEGLKWTIHSIICHTGETPKNGHYYAVIFGSDNKWFIFDDQEIPSLNEVNIKNVDIMNQIKRECVFLIYTYDDIGH
jgi:ubiquitin C-terminal hydrolase